MLVCRNCNIAKEKGHEPIFVVSTDNLWVDRWGCQVDYKKFPVGICTDCGKEAYWDDDAEGDSELMESDIPF